VKQNPFEIKGRNDMRRLGHDVVPANYTQQVEEHWDDSVDGVLVDWKSPTDFPRGNPRPDKIRAEWQAVCHGKYDEVKNNIGWVRGKAVWLAFADTDSDMWIWVKRSELESLVAAKVDWTVFTYSKAQLPDYKAYRRDMRDDLICLIPKVDILALPSTKISLDMPVGL
jgi:hypothetical protein